MLTRVLTTFHCIKISLYKCHTKKLKEGIHMISSMVVFVIIVNWIPEMDERIPTGVSRTKRGSSDGL